MDFLRRIFGGGQKRGGYDTALDLTPPLMPRPDLATMPGVTRQLPDLDTIEKQDNLRLLVGQHSDVGARRTNNEDALLTWVSESSSILDVPYVGIFILADGMGGHAGGEKASALTVQTLGVKLINDVMLSGLSDPDGDRKSVLHILTDGVEAVNQVINEQVPDAGTTCTAAVIVGETLYLAHIGDSRAYLIHDNDVELITRDHSMAGRLIEIGQMNEQEARASQERHTLYKALGKGSVHEPDLVTRTLEPNTWLLLCTDGMWETVTEPAMLDILLNTSSPKAACEQLVALANQNSGDDNISAIVVQAL